MTSFSDLFPQASGNKLHFRGDVVAEVMARPSYGPDLHGARYAPVSATHDEVTDTTTAIFRPIPRPQKESHVHGTAQTHSGPSRSQRRAAARRARHKRRR
ncbi:hypothetical protein SEA_TYPHA_69 [Mycobacterium phage Typha]|uniref:Uncharacterized protein n=1 Tax=Mycobacterium phage Typha TaxID=2517971 RepID=A0A482JAK3_9CAUD|nr:hypothetical protein KCH40_gp100 [Mycobacterium phage Typha]QBP29724.1 hypothetical protein SEA_TYPHA_69 [Mycobacterium phage Typha]